MSSDGTGTGRDFLHICASIDDTVYFSHRSTTSG
jgi:hypothetical protein